MVKYYIEIYNHDNFQIILNKRLCLHISCNNKIIGKNNYCLIHR